MLSRVADSLYWLGRYVERVENIARCIDVNLQLQLDLPGEDRPWEPVIRAAGDASDFFVRYGRASLENVLTFLTLDAKNPNSIVSCAGCARENARRIREIISSEMWMVINHFYLRLSDPSAPAKMSGNPHGFYTEVKEFSQMFIGVADGTMSHDEGWHFTRLGRLTERADQTSRILDVKYFILLPDPTMVGMTLDTVQWTALLKSVSAFEMFRKRYAAVTPRNVSEFLLLSREFPRSLLYCLDKMELSLKSISVNDARCGAHSQRRLGKLRSELEFATINEIIGTGLHEYIDGVQLKLAGIGQAVGQDFFIGA
jgi:uncharacterized alpha-E superfamily protein